MAKNWYDSKQGGIIMRPKSIKPKKQRKYTFDVPRHEAHKLLSAALSPKLRQEKGFKTIGLREGDTVQILRGSHKGKSGKISKTDPDNQRVYVDGIFNKKTDNTEIPVPIHPSNVVISKLVQRDRRRLQIMNRRILEEDKKIDIESVLAEALAEEEDLIEIDDDLDLEGLDDVDLDDDDLDLDDDDFDLIDEDEEDDDDEEEDDD